MMNLGICAIATAIVLQAGNAGNVAASLETVPPQRITVCDRVCDSQFNQNLLQQICGMTSNGSWNSISGIILGGNCINGGSPEGSWKFSICPPCVGNPGNSTGNPICPPCVENPGNSTGNPICPPAVDNPCNPTGKPDCPPGVTPTTVPTVLPTVPTAAPTVTPTTVPTVPPTVPTAAPTVVPTIAPTAVPGAGESMAYRYGQRITELVNEHRAAAGLAAVEYSAELSKPAQVRAAEIQNSFAHTRPDGRYFSSILSDFGISYRFCGENIAWGQKSPEEVVTAWMNSASHRANILNASYRKLGVGVVQNERGSLYFTQLFTN